MSISYVREEDGKHIVEDTTLVTQEHYHNTYEGGSGDYGLSDIEIPRLDIVQSVGDLSEHFEPGQAVLMREFAIPQPVRLTVFGHKKYYIQNIEYEEGVLKKEFDTAEQVATAGGNLDTGKKPGEDSNNFVAGSKILVAIELPAELAETPGVLEYEDKLIARAIWKVQKIAYTCIIRRINLVEAPLKLKGKHISSKVGELVVERKKFGKHWIQVPEIKFVGNNTEEYLTFLRRVF